MLIVVYDMKARRATRPSTNLNTFSLHILLLVFAVNAGTWHNHDILFPCETVVINMVSTVSLCPQDVLEETCYNKF